MTNCEVCKGKKLDDWGKIGNKRMWVCKDCGLGMIKGVKEQYVQYHRDEDYRKLEDIYENMLQKRVEIIKRFVSRGSVLEIGSSQGTMLNLFKKQGFEVLGIEPSKEAAKRAKLRGIETITSDFLKTKLNSGIFDVVIMNHVLEHLDDLRATLKEAKRVLKKGGYLYLDVPNFGGLRAKIFKKKWRYLLPDEHKWQFTPTSLSYLLKDYGFEVMMCESRSGIWENSKPLRSLTNDLIKLRKRFLKSIVDLIPDSIVTWLNLGDSMGILARK